MGKDNKQSRREWKKYRKQDPVNHDLTYEHWLSFFPEDEQPTADVELGLELVECETI